MNRSAATTLLVRMNQVMFLWLVILLSADAVAEQSVESDIGISADYWIRHMEEDLLPFWDKINGGLLEDSPFPTHVFDHGSPVAAEDIDEYRKKAIENDGKGLLKGVGKNYIRMHARQTYVYGVAFHLTGDPDYFRLMQQGVDYSSEYGFDKYGALTVFGDADDPKNTSGERTSQDQAYSLMGLAFYYYLTRDEKILATIMKQHEYILKTYGVYNADGDLRDMLWLPKDTESVELVAALDQLNAYMVLLYPVLPDEYKGKWARTMADLCKVMLDKFFVEKVKWNDTEVVVKSFWGRLDDKKFGGRHFDFGHSVKAWWMINLVGRLIGDENLTEMGKEGADYILEKGFVKGNTLVNAALERNILNYPKSLAEESTWGEKFSPEEDKWWVQNGVSLGQEWWIHCEMDQTAAMIYENADHIDRWVATSKFFVNRFVDHGAGGIWHSLDPATLTPKLMKVHSWKNGYHSFEHALIMAIASQKVRDERIGLHFAVKGRSCGDVELRPYYFSGSVYNMKYATLGDTLMRSCKVEFAID